MLLLVLLAGYWVLSSRPCESERAAVVDLRALNYAQMEYEQTHPAAGYAPTLAELRAAELIDETLATGTAHDYRFALTAGPQESSGRIQAYRANADPPFRVLGHCSSFFTDESGVIRFTRENRAATVADSPLK